LDNKILKIGIILKMVMVMHLPMEINGMYMILMIGDIT